MINKKTIETVTVGIYDQNMNNVDMNSDNGTKPYENWNCGIEINEGIIKNLKYIIYMTSLKINRYTHEIDGSGFLDDIKNKVLEKFIQFMHVLV